MRTLHELLALPPEAELEPGEGSTLERHWQRVREDQRLLLEDIAELHAQERTANRPRQARIRRELDGLCAMLAELEDEV